jgi:F-type H+-transporting ATPase subunit a
LAADNPLSHVVQHPLIQKDVATTLLTPEGKLTLLSDQIAMMMVGGLLLALLVPMLVRKRRGRDEIGRLVPSGFANAFEAICEYLRKEVAEPVLGEHADRFVKYIWSAFFFVLTVNLLGLLPIGAVANVFHLHLGGTATGNVWVTATMAILTMVLMVYNGLRYGGKHYLAHFCPGPIWLAWLLVPLEIIGLLSKIFALTMRLFANMIAGHILLAVLMSFILGGFTALGSGLGFVVAVPVIVGSVAITFLEILVALLQAFIFTFLTALFIGMSVVFEHDEHPAAEAH